MIVTLKWLKDYVNLDGITAKEIADAFTFSGFEMETYKDLSEKLNNVVVGRIDKIEKHPNADKLLICSIFDGTKHNQIITHATNMKEGDLVPVALSGADLANGVKIKPTNMRGVDSCGMMCAGEELGIDNSVYEGAETDGIMILSPNDCKVGEPMAKVLGMDDVVYDVNVLANRPDCQSVVGLAKELACALQREFKSPSLSYNSSADDLELQIENKTENCLYYTAQVVRNVKIGPSPKWLQDRLHLVGLNSINNIIDITNFVLWEMGQPLHAFDYQKIAGNKIIIRQANNNEELTLLNKEKYKLNSQNMVIANNNQSMALAGVMGGEEFSISSDTKDIVIESATFKKENIRKTARSIGIRTDASGRYERGVEPVSCCLGLNRALSLIESLGVGEISNKLHKSENLEFKNKVIEIDYNRVLSWLGVDIPTEEAIAILNKLDIQVEQNGNIFKCEIPQIRSDIENFSDIAEEIIRYYGFDKLPLKSNDDTKSIGGGYEKEVERNLELKQLMITTGANEIKTFTLSDPVELEKLGISKESDLFTRQVKIRNPLNVFMSVMRTQTLSSMLGAVKYNLNHKNTEFSLFEIGKTFFSTGSNTIGEEKETLNFVTTQKDFDFFKVKSIVEMVAQKLGVTFSYEQTKQDATKISNALHPNISANIIWANQIIGVIGKVHPRVLKSYEINGDVYFFEINLSVLPQKKTKKVKQTAKYPSSTRDLAVVVKEDVTVGKIIELIKKSAGNLCESVEFFDVYQGEQLQKDEKSVAVRLVFRKQDGTLTQEEINNQVENVLSQLSAKLEARLR